jgi:hypothetical protein
MWFSSRLKVPHETMAILEKDISPTKITPLETGRIKKRSTEQDLYLITFFNNTQTHALFPHHSGPALRALSLIAGCPQLVRRLFTAFWAYTVTSGACRETAS